MLSKVCVHFKVSGLIEIFRLQVCRARGQSSYETELSCQFCKRPGFFLVVVVHTFFAPVIVDTVCLGSWCLFYLHTSITHKSQYGIELPTFFSADLLTCMRKMSLCMIRLRPSCQSYESLQYLPNISKTLILGHGTIQLLNKSLIGTVLGPLLFCCLSSITSVFGEWFDFSLSVLFLFFFLFFFVKDQLMDTKPTF